MSVSRFSVLAVFLMMVLSAFVALPNYYAGAEHDEDTQHGAYFVYIMTEDRADAIVEATPLSLHFGAPPMSDNSPYELELICEGAEEGILGIYGTWVTSEGGNAGDFNDITSWSVRNTNGIELENFKYDPMSDIIGFEHPMVVFEDNESSGSGHIPAEVYDQEEFYCDGSDGFFDPVSQDIVVDMISLSEWEISVDVTFSSEASNQFRQEIYESCSHMGGSEDPVITATCLEMYNADDSEGPDEGGCPPEWGFDDIACEDFHDACHGGGMSMSCLHIMYELCYISDVGGEMCDDFGDDGVIYYCSNDGEDYAESMGGILCPEGPDVVPMCPNDELCVCIDIDGSCDDGDDDWGYYDGPDMLSFIWQVIGYDRGDNTSADLVDFTSDFIAEMGIGDDHDDIPDMANYDVYHIDINEEDAANYTVDVHGEHDETTGEWFEPGFVYMYEGTLDYPTSDLDNDTYSWMGGNERVCEYDTTETHVYCDNSLGGYLEAGNYSMFVTNNCEQRWEHNESSDRYEFEGYDCRYGSYNLSVTNDDNGSHVDNVIGEISEDDPEFLFGDVHESHIWDSQEFAFFTYYETHSFTLDNGMNASYFYSDQDAPHNDTLVVWLYSGSFNHSDWSENLMYVSSGFEHYNGSGDYNYSYFNMAEFEPGNYVFVTTGSHTHSTGTYDAVIGNEDGDILDSWSGELCGDLYDSCEGQQQEDDRTYFNYWYHEYYQEMDHYEGDGEDLWHYFWMAMYENFTAYENNEITETEFADAITALLYEMDEMGAFEGDGGPSPEEALEATDANGDGYMSFEEFQDHWEAQNDTADLDWSDVQVLFNDADTNDDDLLELDELQYFIDGIESMTSGGDGGNGDSDDCPFDNATACEDFGHMSEYMDDFEFGLEIAHYCLENDDSGCELVDSICADPTPENETVCEGIADFNHDDYHGGGEYPLLDFISGYADPHDWSDFMMFNEENIIGYLSDNEDSHATVSGSFILVFDDVDGTLDTHFFSLGSHLTFWCSDEVGGEPNTEVLFHLVNDGAEDCGDGADEPQYDADGEEINWFDCHDGTQISMNKVNDGIYDCYDGEDEGHYGDDHDEEFSVTFNLLDDYKIINCMHCVEGVFSDDNTSVTFDVEYNTFEIEFAHTSYEEEDDCPVDDDAWCEEAEIICDSDHEDTNATACAELVIDFCEADGNEDHVFCAEVDELCDNKAYPDGDGVWGEWEDSFCEVYNFEEEPETDPVDLPTCDHNITIDEANVFDPADLTINVGDTVCWQWTNTTNPHNVVEIDVEYDAALNLTNVMKGFSSGEANTSGDFRHTFTTDDMTHYYVCELHASEGMVGKITVGEGSPEKEEAVETAVEESGLPSVSFIVGIIVLVGAAGLRRRIH